jgi:hypothetical protein
MFIGSYLAEDVGFLWAIVYSMASFGEEVKPKIVRNVKRPYECERGKTYQLFLTKFLLLHY